MIPNPPSWKSEREIEFAESVELWGVTVTRNGLEAQGIKTKDAVGSLMQSSNYLINIRTLVTLLRADFDRLGLRENRSQFTCDGQKYEIVKFYDDSADATIDFDSYQVT